MTDSAIARQAVTEGLGPSLLDAMAASRPIVATTAGGIPEIVDDGVNGLLVPPRDHHALAGAIVRALKDAELRCRMGDAGFARTVDGAPMSVFLACRMQDETFWAVLVSSQRVRDPFVVRPDIERPFSKQMVGGAWELIELY